MGNCVSPAAVPVAVSTSLPDEKYKIIANLKMDLMWQRLELEQKCKSLELKCQSLTVELERREDEYLEQVAVSTEWKSKLWLLKSAAIPRMKELALLRCSTPGRN